MANLETLELTISANAESASRGLSGLIDSLTALSRKVGKTVGGLKLLNSQLETLKGFSNIKFTGIEKAAKDVKNAVDIPGTKLDALKMKLTGVTEAMEKAAGKGNKLSVANKRLQQFTIEKQIKKETESLKARGEVLKEYKKLAPGTFKSWMYGPNPLPKITNNTGSASGMIPDNEFRKLHPELYVDYDSPEGKAMIAARNAALKKRGDALPIASDPKTLNQFKNTIKSKLIAYLNKKADYSHLGEFINQKLGIGVKPKSAKDSASAFGQLSMTDRFKNGIKNISGELKKFGHEVKSVLPRFTALHRVMRIASTMLIRTGIRTLFKGISEGLGNYYQYSKNIGGEFASVADQLSSSWATLKNQMGAAIAPALSAAIPVINSLASAATTAFNALSQLFALLTGKGSWSKATTQVQAFDATAKKAGGGGGGMQELLAKFDELNVITSEGGGGGGGGGVADDFTNMFEEMYDFDSKIRDVANFIRETIDWVRENFDVLLATAGLIGVAILGWKISKAFDDALSTMGKWIEGGALITLGIVLDFDFGRKLGSSLAGGEELKPADFIEGVAGIIAAGVGGYVIGGGVGAAVGIGIAVVATITGIMVGWNSQKNKMKWGSDSLTPEQVKAYVQSQFAFDVESEIKIVSAEISNSRTAKLHMDGAVSELSRTIQKIQIGVEDPAEIYADAVKAIDDTITMLREYTASEENLLTAYLQVLPYDNSTKEGITKDIFSANKTLNEYFEAQGKKAADLYDQGMKNGWKENEQEQILALMEHLNNIYSKAEANRDSMKVKASLKVEMDKLSLNNFSEETAKAVYKEQKSILDKFTSEMEAAMVEQVSQLEYFATLAEEAGLMDPATGRKLADVYREKARFITDSFQDEMGKKLGSAKSEMKEEWEATLIDVYGSDYSHAVISHIGKGFEKNLQDSLRKDEESAKQLIRETLERATKVNTITKNVTELFGIKGWDLLSNKAKTQFFESVYNAIAEEAVPLLKEELNLSIADLVSITNWKSFEDEQKIKFLGAIRNAYGTKEAEQFAKGVGTTLAAEIINGLKSKDENARNAARDMLKSIQDELDKKGIHIDASADLELAIKAIIEYEVKENIKKGTTSAKTVTAGSTSSSIKPAKTNISMTKATGAYGIPAGDVFIANEAGAELVGSINGKTSVANQAQIIEGIASGVERANSEQNSLLRQQNELLRGILEKENIVRFGASPALGRTVRQSLNMYSNVTGG